MARRRSKKKKEKFKCLHCGDEFDFDVAWCESCQTHTGLFFFGKNKERQICQRCIEGNNDHYLERKGWLERSKELREGLPDADKYNKMDPRERMHGPCWESVLAKRPDLDPTKEAEL